jgi:hypothetical protein
LIGSSHAKQTNNYTGNTMKTTNVPVILMISDGEITRSIVDMSRLENTVLIITP